MFGKVQNQFTQIPDSQWFFTGLVMGEGASRAEQDGKGKEIQAISVDINF